MENLQQQFEKDLLIKGFSPRTIGTYQRCIQTYLRFYDHKINPESGKDVKEFLHYLLHKRRVSRAYMHQYYSALKYFYTITLERNWEIMRIPRVKREKRLPDILDRQEITTLIDVTTNIKHKALLMITYSAGLRVSETASLKNQDIDSKRMSIKVRGGKGRKDRYTLLSKKSLLFLREYYKLYRPHHWLFEGQVKSKPLHTSTLQRVFTRAKEKAGIQKKVSIHSLRHSCATHLLEQGTDIHVVQRLLGHSNIKTTMVYLHLKKESLMKVVNPLDFSFDEEKT